MKPIAVLTHWVHPEIIEFLEENCEVIPNQTRKTLPKSEIIARCQDATALMAFMPDCVDAEFLDACPSLGIVAGALKGYDNLDAMACEERGVWLTIIPDLLTIPTAELTHGLMITLARNIFPSDTYMRSGNFRGWEPRFYGGGLDGSTVGILGMGAVGKALARMLTGYNTNLIYYDLYQLDHGLEQDLQARYAELDKLLVTSDFVVSILPMSKETLHFIDKDELACMKEGAYLVNTGRGSTVNEQAVVNALNSGKLAGYAADVYEFEDWARMDRPRQVPTELLDETLPTILTTHIGSAVDKVRFQIAMEAAQNIDQFFRRQKPFGAVNLPEISEIIEA